MLGAAHMRQIIKIISARRVPGTCFYLLTVRSVVQEPVKELNFCVQYVKCFVEPIDAKFLDNICNVTIIADTASSGSFIPWIL